MNNKLHGSAEMSAAMVISGTIGLFVVLSGQAVMDVVFWRCVFGAAVLLLVCWWMGLLKPGVVTRRQVFLAAWGGVAIVLNWLLLFSAYSRVSISIATAVYNTQPFMLVGLGAAFFGERLTLTKLGWLMLAFLGVLAIVHSKPDGGYVGSDYGAGILLALGAAFFYAVAAIIAKKLKGVPPHLIALIQVSVGIFMLAPMADMSDLSIGAGGWGILITLGVVHTGLMYILLYGAIQKLPTNITGALSFIYPIVAILVDLMAFGIRLQLLQIAGSAAILVAAAAMTLGWPVWRKRIAVTE